MLIIGPIFVIVGLGLILLILTDDGSMYSIFESPIAIWGIVSIFPIIGIILLIYALRKKKQTRDTYINGVPTTATISFVGEDMSVKINQKHPTKVAWKFNLSAHSYQGSISHMDPEKLREFSEGQEITVLYNPNNPELNTMYLA